MRDRASEMSSITADYRMNLEAIAADPLSLVDFRKTEPFYQRGDACIAVSPSVRASETIARLSNTSEFHCAPGSPPPPPPRVAPARVRPRHSAQELTKTLNLEYHWIPVHHHQGCPIWSRCYTQRWYRL